MPCDCSHLEPNQRERESVRLMTFLNEIGLIKYEPGSYGDVKRLDDHTIMLCEFCQNNDLTRYSLELQIWWRDHQEADRKRVEFQLKQAKEEDERREALAKLTPYERKLLGI